MACTTSKWHQSKKGSGVIAVSCKMIEEIQKRVRTYLQEKKIASWELQQVTKEEIEMEKQKEKNKKAEVEVIGNLKNILLRDHLAQDHKEVKEKNDDSHYSSEERRFLGSQ
ncbi:hypothetical protein SUGI_0027010 [Cryptomeria japonica]|nr:hypothetical protein SUGI_0027010 [Cryptomeria japonica]